MGILAETKVYALAVRAGFTPSEAITMTAIAGAESGFNSDPAPNSNSNGTHDVGLFQINSAHGYGDAQMKDPAQNAAAAYAIYQSQGFGAWSTWAPTGPAPFRNFTDRAQAAAGVVAYGGKQPSAEQLSQFIDRSGGDSGQVNAATLGGTLAAGVASASPLAMFGKIAGVLSSPQWWRRIGIGAGGTLLLLIALVILLSESKTVQTATKTIAKVAA